MGSDFSTRPVRASAAASKVQPAIKAADRAVATELPAYQTVTAADAGGGVHYGAHAAEDDMPHQVVLEPSAAWFVDQVVDGKTSLQPYTDEASLRRRAYFQAQHLTRRAPRRLLTTDRKA
jgi:hypothetical protein